MEHSEKKQLAEQIKSLIANLSMDSDGWIPFTLIGGALNASGIRYKEFGYPKLRPFMNELNEYFEFKDVSEEGKPPVCFLRSKEDNPEQAAQEQDAALLGRGEKFPGTDSRLFSWSFISHQNITALSELALDEKWYYGSNAEGRELPILKNYLTYTFKRLCFEQKICFATDPVRKEEYAAFNTGLVDKKYEYIYALFKKNTRFASPYWYLLSFVVAGEDVGKTLVSLFNPLPERANYFGNKVENMIYDTTSGNLSCDYTHIITERTHRLPKDFLEDNCPADFLCIDGISVSHMSAALPENEKKAYFQALGEKIKNTPRILNRLKNRIDDAVCLALKRTEWNYKTAIPMYFPAKNTGSLLLPLTLVDEDRVDLTLVVERQPSGSYQGQTILPLNLAYSNSRLVCRPDSDWLKTDLLGMVEPVETDDEDE